MESIICSKCKQTKGRDKFYENKYKKNGLYSWCKECHVRETVRKRYRPNPKSIKGILLLRWQGINNRHGETYRHVKVLISKKRFFEIMDNDELKKLLHEWEISGYNTKKTPSVDRIDSKGHYEEGNIRWLTVSDNASLGAKGAPKKPIAQYSISGEFIKIYPSRQDAVTALGKKPAAAGNLKSCAKGAIKSAYGYKWKDIIQ